MSTAKQLAALIMDSDLPARLQAANERVREAAKRVIDSRGENRERALDHLADVIGYTCGKSE